MGGCVTSVHGVHGVCGCVTSVHVCRCLVELLEDLEQVDTTSSWNNVVSSRYDRPPTHLLCVCGSYL